MAAWMMGIIEYEKDERRMTSPVLCLIRLLTPVVQYLLFFFASRRRHTRCSRDWSSDVCSSDLGGGGSSGDVVRHVLSRAVGARLVLSERFLAALEERYRRLDRPVPRRAERLALLPQGASTWPVDGGEPGWALESGARAFAVLARDAGLPAALAEHLVPFARDAESLELVVGRLLLERRLTLAVAESCTGGLLGHRLTNVPGSSAYFERGVLVYSNRAKEELLGVPAEILRVQGAVSAPCAEAMVRGVCERAGTPCGLAITGIAGPEGGTAAKPVGTVFVALAVPGGVSSRRFRFAGDRASVKWQSTQAPL